MKKLIKVCMLFFLLLSCEDADNKNKINTIDDTIDEGYLTESEVFEINVESPISEREIETSGLSWFKDKLVFLPQYPHLFGDQKDGNLYFAKKSDLMKIISEKSNEVLQVEPILFSAKNLDEYGKARGSGYEAITFNGNVVYVAIESIEDNGISSYLVKGEVFGELDSIVLDAATLTSVASNTNINNMGEEAITFWNNSLYGIHEANGLNIIEAPTAGLTDFVSELSTLPFPHVEYRITDATKVDSEGRFWAINYFFPGDGAKLFPAKDPLVDLYGIGRTNQKSSSIERLLEFEITPTSIKLVDQQPIYLEISGLVGRNWEGIARLDDLGFLIISDYFPKSIFAFVEIAGN
jgi:hypothetical protein